MGDFFTPENVDLIIKLGVVVLIIAAVLWVIRKIRKAKRAVRRVINTLANQAFEGERVAREQRLSTPGGSSETQGSGSTEVRKALREQKATCSSCGAPNNSIEVFCPYCGSSLIK